ncbi:inverse autotransporter beta domain-containing protein [Xenorhabdus lircayensis]|uniref:Inverse autotransporter beta domain-containing protein n=1 Tax=Xenorhabdus lircayensis TaxID=2763499 RepID=A0ABS0U8G4_9GAMM|nr:inverse autotransporter beta domain-containing protein [Xenorhabdus lircayensis]MBI6550168.1 inverse autotransporter beta domain-containing protein [Xenorhabdus lircayensis]
MDSSISNKFSRSFVFICSLFLPFTSMSTFAVGEKNPDHQLQKEILQKTESENSIYNKEDNKAGVIAQNIQRVGGMLSSSPSQLADQAKSYALGKLNSTVSSEAHKWLSQFGTAKINLSLDRKGKLDNSSLDFLLPLYDNKADWLVFTQLGYRNKDSRNTANFGVGGRYFTSSWMYGLNTFYDYDISGKNKRLGFGGEAWADYVKLSANTYLRLSGWHQSFKEMDYDERPANGFDLNGEFFLPAYPNLGGKLSYEQYFGDNVALFNRDTKQKNPSLARFGLNYTPIPLVTMGVDYKSGSGGRSETLLQANLNYRFGVPLNIQLSPDNVASMRTLAGSRYDLVERNNNIVLDYRKKEVLRVTLPNSLTGYSYEKKSITAEVTSDRPIKQVTWMIGEAFRQNGGDIPVNGKDIDIVLPQYKSDRANSYPVFAIAQDDTGKEVKSEVMILTVEPMSVQTSVTPNRAVRADGQAAFTLSATLNYGDGNTPIKNKVIEGVNWYVEFPKGQGAEPYKQDDVDIRWEKPAETNEQGQLTAKLFSQVPQTGFKVYLEIKGMPKILVNKTEQINFIQNNFYITQLESAPKVPIAINKPNNVYTLSALVLDSYGAPISKKELKDVHWVMDAPNSKITPENNNTTDEQGWLFATLQSTQAQTVRVGISVADPLNDGIDPPIYFEPVVFVDDTQKLSVSKFEFDPSTGIFEADGKKYTVTATVVGSDGKPYANKVVEPVWSIEALPAVSGAIITSVNTTTGKHGELKATLSSTEGIKNAKVGITLNGSPAILSQTFDFNPVNPIDAEIKGKMEISSDEPLPADGVNKYTYKVLIVDPKTSNPIRNHSFTDVNWSMTNGKEALPEELKLIDMRQATDNDGYLTASLVSRAGVDNVVVKVTTDVNQKPLTAVADKNVSFTAIERETKVHVSFTNGSSQNFHRGQPDYVYEQVEFRFSDPRGGNLLYAKPINTELNDVIYHIPAGASIEQVVDDKQDKYLAFSPRKFKPGPVKVIAEVTTKKTGGKYIYSYTFNPKKFIFSPHLGGDDYVKYDGEGKPNSTCELLEPKYSWNIGNVKSVTDEMLGIVGSSQSSYSFTEEYNTSDFVSIGLVTPASNTNVKVAYIRDGRENFYLYDYSNKQISDYAFNAKGRLICVLP